MCGADIHATRCSRTKCARSCCTGQLIHQCSRSLRVCGGYPKRRLRGSRERGEGWWGGEGWGEGGFEINKMLAARRVVSSVILACMHSRQIGVWFSTRCRYHVLRAGSRKESSSTVTTSLQQHLCSGMECPRFVQWKCLPQLSMRYSRHRICISSISAALADSTDKALGYSVPLLCPWLFLIDRGIAGRAGHRRPHENPATRSNVFARVLTFVNSSSRRALSPDHLARLHERAIVHQQQCA